MRVELKPHPDWPCPAVEQMEAEVQRPAHDVVWVRFRVVGAIAQLRLPPGRSSARTDELWRTTCFEAFLRPPGQTGYLEFNFAPSGAWAAYAFDDYREGMRPLEPFAGPRVVAESGADQLVVQVEAQVAGLGDGGWRLGLSAVLEGLDGARSYWAAAHPPGKPDFHHPDCFALELPKARTP